MLGRAPRTHSGWEAPLWSLLMINLLCVPMASPAQEANPFGVQDRANAAQRMIVLGVQQGISSLPPTQGQSFTFDFNSELGTYTTSERLGPTSFRSPQTVGKGKLSLRLAVSYFDLADTLLSTTYKVTGLTYPDPPGYCTQFGLRADSRVGLINLAANYGISNRLEIDVNLPVVVSDTSASEIHFARPDAPTLVQPVACGANVALQRVETPFQKVDLGAGKMVAFNEGTSVGVGRISIGAKAVLYSGKWLDLAFSPEFFFPSPSEDQFAGSASAAILPRVVAQAKFANPLRLHVDAGYDYDFDHDELRRFTWNAGASLPLAFSIPIALDDKPPASPEFPVLHALVDFGLGGSKFNQGIQWTPDRASFVDEAGSPARIRALGSNRLGDNFVDFLGGIKIRVGDQSIVSGSVSVPVNDEGFRADAVGTLAVEYYF